MLPATKCAASRARVLVSYRVGVYSISKRNASDAQEKKTLKYQESKDPRVLIVGSGVTGLTTALALQQRGISSQVVGAPDQTDGSVVIGFNGARVLQSISPSLYENVRDAGKAITVLEVCNSKGKAFGRVDYTALGKKMNLSPIGISTNALLSILSKECFRTPQKDAGKIMVDKSTSFVAAVNEPNKPSLCRFGGGRTSSVYDVVVGADGTNSRIREEYFKSPDFEVKKRYGGFLMLSAIVDRPFMFSADVMSELWGEERRLIGIPISRDQVQLHGAYLTQYAPHMFKEGDKPAAEFVKQFPLFGGFAPHVSYALETSNKPAYLTVPREISINKYSNGRVVLVGNAAHTLIPNVQMSETLNLEDAVILANSLADNTHATVEERLDAYSKERVPRVDKVMKTAWDITDIGHRGRISHILFTPWTVRSGKLESREKSFINGFKLPNASQ